MSDVQVTSRILGRRTGFSAAVIGMGIEGESLAHYFLKQGARVTVHHWMSLEDLKEDPRLGPQYEGLAAAGAGFNTGQAYLTGLTTCDVVGVVQSAFTHKYPENQAALDEVRSLGIPLVTNMSIFFEQCPAPIIGVTGTNGKSTTTEMTAHILGADSGLTPSTHLAKTSGKGAKQKTRRVWAGGNLGSSPLAVLDDLTADDMVLLELSNYQLEFLDRSPWIAAVTNIAPDHLVDYGGDYRAYKAAKRRILDFQSRDDWAVLNYDDPVTRAWLVACQAQPFSFSRQAPLQQGAFVQAEHIVVRHNTEETIICETSALNVRGAHNLENALCAAAISTLAGVAGEDIAAGLAEYRTGAHRLEYVGEWAGVQFYNDSKSTTPSSTRAAIRAFPGQSIVLLVGGRDKGLPWDELVQAVRGTVREVVVFGEARHFLARTFAPAAAGASSRSGSKLTIRQCMNLDRAVETVVEDMQAGDVVLFSPGCASFDAFGDYAERGSYFKDLIVSALA